MPRHSQPRRARRWVLVGGLALLVVMLALAAAWRWTPLHEIAEPRMIARWLRDSADSPWMPAVVAAIYVSASLVMFPNTVLCFAVILALGPYMGAAYAYGGSLAAALAGHTIGRFGGKRVHKLHLPAVERLSAKLRNGGFFQVLTLRLLPVAPFSATNILSGAARVRRIPFLAATVVGISPYILTFAILGRQARRLWSDPTPMDIAVAGVVVALAAGAMWMAHARARAV